MREAEYVIFADKHNWKYAWFGEHHALTEYSHMSAPEVVMGCIAGADRLHPPRASGINSLSPRKEHPVRFAERAAMLDHFTNNRYEWGTGRGAGSHEVATFNIMDTELDQGRVGRGHPRDPAHVGAGRLLVRGRALHRAHAAQHPPQAVRQGSPADLGGVRQPAHVRPGRRARHRRHRLQLRADLQPAGAASTPTRKAIAQLHRARSASSRTTT